MRRKLLAWYDRNRRDLPWRRRSSDAYAQWVAEIMLQQTRVQTVIPYYERFLALFPTVESLAAASTDQLLHAWQGLGYYRRARNLHAAARQLVARGQGLPATGEQWRALPGIGEYTAAAIASVACGERSAAVDGNVARVLARLCAVELPIDAAPGKRRIQSLADRLLPAKLCGDFNQAWMDFGSAICTPTSPHCDACPLANDCVAARMGIVERLPVKNGSRAPLRVDRVVAACIYRGRLLMRQRPDCGRWAGLWELPAIDPGRAASAAEGEHKSALESLLGVLGVTPTASPTYIGRTTHALTHRQYHFHVYRVDVRPIRAGPSPYNANAGWTSRDDLKKLALSTAQKRILGRLGWV